MIEALKEILVGAAVILMAVIQVVLVLGFLISPILIMLAVENPYWLLGLIVTVPIGLSAAAYFLD